MCLMRKLSILLLLPLFYYYGYAQKSTESKVVTKTFEAASIAGNKAGEDANRRLSIYLPPGYDQSNERYPVIYFLHGFAVNDEQMMQWIGFKALMDSAIKSGMMKPMILVLPNSDTKFRGYFYTNSSFTGNWTDFIGKDVVQYVDKNFRTKAHRDSRGLCGHSMGGNGALKVAMLYADVFSSVYAMSPGGMHFAAEFTPAHKAFRQLSEISSVEDVFKGFDSPETTDDASFFRVVFASMARTFAPDESNKAFQGKIPVSYSGKTRKIDPVVLKKWESNFNINMIEDHLSALQSLKAIKIDWGRNEEFSHIPLTNMQFSKKLEAYGINHFAEEYIGDHVNMLDGFEGRIFTELLPFFERYLK